MSSSVSFNYLLSFIISPTNRKRPLVVSRFISSQLGCAPWLWFSVVVVVVVVLDGQRKENPTGLKLKFLFALLFH